MSDKPVQATDFNVRFTALLMKHRGPLFGYIFSCVTNHADAEDILQEVSMIAMSQFEQLQDDSGFLPWTLEIARRTTLAHRRRSGREPVMPSEVITALATSAQQVAQDSESQRTVGYLHECLDELPLENAELIGARYEASFESVGQLARSIGRSESATYALIKRIRFSLRDCVTRKLSAERSS